MRSIKKLKESSKAVAGTALLVGATLTAGGAAVVAQDSGSSGDLGDYPQPFINEDGEVSSTIVMGEDAAAIDVVAASNIAGQLGNDAFSTETVSAGSGGTAGTWSADNGITLNRQNTNLFLDDTSADGQTRLDDTDVNVLDTTTFQSEDNEEVEVEHDVQISSQDQEFTPEGDYDNPVLHLNNPANPTANDHLFQASVEFDSTMDFQAAGESSPDLDGDAQEWVEDGDEIELFGTDYTFSEESDENELVLYGSSDRVEVNTGEETTVTVNGNEVTLSATYVTEGSGNPTATVSVDGSTENVEEGDSVGPNGNIRISDIYRTGPDGAGRVAFSQGSDEVIISYGTDGSEGDVEVDGDTVDGVSVSVDSASGSSGSAGQFAQTDGMTFYFGAAESDQDFIEAGESYEDPLFGLEFHYGGLNPEVSDADNAAEVIEVTADEEDTAEVSFTTSGGEDTSLTVYDEDPNSGEESFGDDDGTIAQYEGQFINEDDKVVLNAFEEAAMYEVTEIEDSDLGTTETEGTISVTLENVVTGDSVEVEEDGVDFDANSGDYTIQDESIEGKDFDVTFDESSTQVSFVRSTADGHRQLWPHMYTATDSAITFDEPSNDINLTSVFDVTTGDFARELNSDLTGVSGDVTVEVFDSDNNTVTPSQVTLYNDNNVAVGSSSGSAQTTVSATGSNVSAVAVEGVNQEVTIGVVTGGSVPTPNDNAADYTQQTDQVAGYEARTADLPSGVISNDAEAAVWFNGTDSVGTVAVQDSFVQYDSALDINLGTDGDIDLARSNSGDDTGILLTQPENDDDEEEAYVIEADSQSGSQNAQIDAYTGFRLEDQLDDEDVDVAYDEFGAYTAYDYDDDETDSLTLHYPGAQSTSGMAFTGADGSLSADGSSGGSSDVETMMPTGWSSQYTALDSDSSVSSAKQDSNLILVGGPSVNSLVGELVEANETMAASEYTEGQGMIQLVEDAFTEGNDALVVAGYAGEDTRQAGQFLANYEQNSDAMEGSTQVTIDTAEGTVVQ